MKKITIHLPELFEGEMLGGYLPSDWDNLTQSERLAARLAFIKSRARILADIPYDPDNGLPVNVCIEASRLANKAESALFALDADDSATAVWLAVEVGMSLERIKTVLAVAMAFDLKVTAHKPRKKGGDTTAQLKKESAKKNIAQAVEHWKRLDKTETPKHNRAGIIANIMGHPPDTVRYWIKKAGLR